MGKMLLTEQCHQAYTIFYTIISVIFVNKKANTCNPQLYILSHYSILQCGV